jgi:hypothetical protein
VPPTHLTQHLLRLVQQQLHLRRCLLQLGMKLLLLHQQLHLRRCLLQLGMKLLLLHQQLALPLLLPAEL